MQKVSVIIPTYNRADRIKGCLDSIFRQTYHNIEVIIVDDGSEDNTEEVVATYYTTCPPNMFVRYYKQPNLGAPAARNLGLKKSTGEYVVFFDSDDYMQPERIQMQIEAINKFNANCCICGYITASNGQIWLPPYCVNDYLKLYARGKIRCSTQIWMYKKELVLKVNGYDTELICFQDFDLAFRILWDNDIKICSVLRPLTVFVDHGGQERIMHKWYSEKGLLNKKRVLDKMLIQIVGKKSLYIFPYTRLYFRMYEMLHSSERYLLFKKMSKEYNALILQYSFFIRFNLLLYKWAYVIYCKLRYAFTNAM